MSDVWYFAYGSNLSTAQKVLRTGAVRRGAERPRIATLHNYRLAFNKRGGHGQVYANVMPCQDDSVIGVIYRCSPAAIDEMSQYEIGYEQQVVTVVLEEGSQAEAIIYVAASRNIVDEARPSD
ncbi:MAG: gamma-glutamylcyclotransferase family protein, partial [Planctomycetaceae bacterium]